MRKSFEIWYTLVRFIVNSGVVARDAQIFKITRYIFNLERTDFQERQFNGS